MMFGHLGNFKLPTMEENTRLIINNRKNTDQLLNKIIDDYTNSKKKYEDVEKIENDNTKKGLPFLSKIRVFKRLPRSTP